MRKLVLVVSAFFCVNLVQAKNGKPSKAEESTREPASVRCYAKGDQDGYSKALEDFKSLTGKPAGCMRFHSQKIEGKCETSSEYQTGFSNGYSQTMRQNVQAHLTDACPGV